MWQSTRRSISQPPQRIIFTTSEGVDRLMFCFQICKFQKLLGFSLTAAAYYPVTAWVFSPKLGHCPRLISHLPRSQSTTTAGTSTSYPDSQASVENPFSKAEQPLERERKRERKHDIISLCSVPGRIC